MAHTYLEDIKNSIQEADLVVVGLGEEWNISPKAQESDVYKRIQEDLAKYPQFRWILPYVYKKLTDETLKAAYETLFSLLEGKNYYVVATCVNDSFVPFVANEKWVMPCETEKYMRDENLSLATEYTAFMDSLELYVQGKITIEDIDFVKNALGEIVPFNNIYASHYKEEGYLPKWTPYMSWLQGTMNRNTCLLELGAGLTFPSVFRFPFEKMTYFNRKAKCFRVNKTLYQLTEEMAERSVSVPIHSVTLFSGTCEG